MVITKTPAKRGAPKDANRGVRNNQIAEAKDQNVSGKSNQLMKIFVLNESEAYGEHRTSFFTAETLTDVQFDYLYRMGCFLEKDKVQLWLDPNSNSGIKASNAAREGFGQIPGARSDPILFFQQATDNSIDSFFRFCFTGGDGYQWGLPGKEWHTSTVSLYSDAHFRPVIPRRNFDVAAAMDHDEYKQFALCTGDVGVEFEVKGY